MLIPSLGTPVVRASETRPAATPGCRPGDRRHQTMTSPGSLTSLFDDLRSPDLPKRDAAAQAIWDRFTADLLALCELEGYTNQEIAAKIGRTERTVENELSRIRRRWTTDGDTEAAV